MKLPDIPAEQIVQGLLDDVSAAQRSTVAKECNASANSAMMRLNLLFPGMTPTSVAPVEAPVAQVFVDRDALLREAMEPRASEVSQ